MRRLHRWCTAGLAIALLTAPLAARADLSFGYEARYAGLGGAGLAIIDNPTQAAVVNPAALSLRTGSLGFQWPNLAVRARGSGLGNAFDQLTTGNPSLDQAVNLARSFGKEPTRLEANFGMGLSASTADLQARAQGNVVVTPGSVFTRWANSGTSDFAAWGVAQSDLVNAFQGVSNQSQLQAAAAQVIANGLKADVLGAAVISPAVGVGFKVPKSLTGSSFGDLRVGVRLKPSRIYYSHWVVQPDVSNVTQADMNSGANAIVSHLGIKAEAAPEMGTTSALSDTSFGMDVGFLYQPAKIPYTTFALTVDNLVEPSFKLPNAIGVPRAGQPLLPRTFSAGAALQIPAGFLVAADLVDITGAQGKAQFRVGAEMRPNLPVLKLFALRAGYNSGTGLAAGLGIGGFGISYASRAPLVASQTLNF